uniref:RNA transcription, translation and transport factor protein n=1 Tax=Phocoena sinus TaxID=42100 RepID=A0A8C9DYU7_PHOSS
MPWVGGPELQGHDQPSATTYHTEQESLFLIETSLIYHKNPLLKDETELRNDVCTEDQKRRYYETEDRGKLRNIHSGDQPKFFEKYLRDVNCSFKIQDG